MNRICLGLATVLLGATSHWHRSDIEETCDSLAEANDFHGVILVARDDRVLMVKPFGVADDDAGTPHDVRSRFFVASLTKPVVAFAALRLVDRGTLELDDLAETYCERLEGTPAGRASIHQLVTHTSGLPHYESTPDLPNAQRCFDSDELLQTIAELDPIGPAGERFHYSGPGYLLLGLVLERAAGRALPALVHELVLDPLGMSASVLVDGSNDPGEHAQLYVRREDSLRPAPRRHASTLRATGDLVTTAGDLHLFLRAIQTGALLEPETRELLVRPVLNRYACGLIVYDDPWLRRKHARHMGTMPGVAAHFVTQLEGGLTCIALSNVSPTGVDDINDRLLLAAFAAQNRAREAPETGAAGDE